MTYDHWKSTNLADAMLGSKEHPMIWPCPYCGEKYEVVEVEAEAGPETNAREIICLACGGPLQGRRGRFVRKYFRIKRKAPAGTAEA